MPIRLRIKDLGDKFEFNNYGVWKEIIENCPYVEKVFPESLHPGFKNVYGLPSPLDYKIKYSDERLKRLMSEIDLYRGKLAFSEDITGSVARDIKRIVHKAMSKKKDLEFECFWR